MPILFRNFFLLAEVNTLEASSGKIVSDFFAHRFYAQG